MYLSDEVGMLLTIIFVIVCILNIILFFKVWRMTNTVENIFKGTKGDGYLGKTSIPNPIRVTKDVVDTFNRKQQKNVDTINKVSPGSAKMGKFKEFNNINLIFNLSKYDLFTE